MVIHQFDVCVLKSGQMVLILQSDASVRTSTVIVAPVVKQNPKEFVAKLNLKINLGEQDYIVRLQELAAVPLNRVASVLANRRDLHEEIMLAVDLLFAGF